MEQIAAAVEGELPAWASVFATLLLALAAAIARRISRRSAKPQGERLGSLERVLESERTRRRQVEALLVQRYGIQLPYWPPDGPNQPRPPADRWDDDEDQDDEDDDDLGPETLHRRIPVPPLDPAISARHRRPNP